MTKAENNAAEVPSGFGRKTAATVEHPFCFACGRENPSGLGLHFTSSRDGWVKAVFACSGCYCGYDGILHGGVIATLLDAAMTHCLFAGGIVAVTVEINVQFRHPVVLNVPVIVSACRERSLGIFHLTRGRLIQNNIIVARATGKFVIRKDGLAPASGGKGEG